MIVLRVVDCVLCVVCCREDARLRPIRLRPAPKSKLAEVEINWPKSNRWCLLCHFFLSFLFFLLLRPQKPELNPKPRTLHPISDGPYRWTHPQVNPPPPDNPPPDNPPPDNPPPDNPPPDNPPPDNPKFRSFFPLFPPQFSFFFSLLGSFRGILVVFLKGGALKCAHWGSRAVV